MAINALIKMFLDAIVMIVERKTSFIGTTGSNFAYIA
jgi:hypothetical protein